jgi:hypothetical protein
MCTLTEGALGAVGERLQEVGHLRVPMLLDSARAACTPRIGSREANVGRDQRAVGGMRSRPLERVVRRQPNDHVAVALAGAAHEVQPVEDPLVEPNLPLALGVDLRLDGDRANRQSGLDRRVRFDADRDPDHGHP